MSAWKDRVGAGTLTGRDEGREVLVAGWVQRIRDHGGLLFLDLRDRSGIIQVTVDPSMDVFRSVGEIKPESTISVRGAVVRRRPDAVNEKLATGEVEIRPSAVTLLAPSLPPPIRPTDSGEVDDVVRLRYRYLDLRRPDLQRNLALRGRLLSAVRRSLEGQGFLEIETPFLTRSTPEGARDFLVPSRLSPGTFYALPQSPQLFKQLLMVAGMERYFQIVRCFRDEDLRADRQPEFTQIDIEMSFADRDEVLEVAERMVRESFGEAAGWEVPLPIPRMTYDEAMATYGTDHPDLRISLRVQDLTDWATRAPVPFLAEAALGGKAVKGLMVPDGARLSRRDVETLAEILVPHGLRLAWAAFSDGEIRGSMAKALDGGEKERLGARDGDLLLVSSGERRQVEGGMGALRLAVAKRLNLIDQTRHAFTWIVDFPLFDWSEEEGHPVPMHHPFTSPRDEDLEKLEADPLGVRSKQYDLVLDGHEIAGGSIRIHRPDIQGRVFKILGLPEEESQEKFRFLLEAFQYGPPPHGGVAFGFDRVVMCLAGTENIRDVIAFPKTARGADPLTGAPAAVDPSQLDELGIRLGERRRDPAAHK